LIGMIAYAAWHNRSLVGRTGRSEIGRPGYVA
jgi:hypothetical protein